MSTSSSPKSDRPFLFLLALIGVFGAIVAAFIAGCFGLVPVLLQNNSSSSSKGTPIVLLMPTPIPSPTFTSLPPTIPPTLTPTALPPILITSPEDQSQVGTHAQVIGKLGTQICDGCQVFVVVHPLRQTSLTPWYGQPDSAQVESDMSFSHKSVNIGIDRQQCGEQFEVWAIISRENLSNKNMTKSQWDQIRRTAESKITVQKKCP